MTTKKMIGKECKFVTYVPQPDYSSPDLHVIKEVIHYDDGSSEPNLHQVKNYNRSFYITRKGMRNHESKKEWEDLTNLVEFKSTQAELTRSIARALGTPWSKGGLKQICASPYVYGADILGTALIKQQYSMKYNTIKPTRHTVGVCDTETDVLHGTGEITMASFTSKTVVFTAVVKSFVKNISAVEEKVERAMDKYLGDVVKQRNIVCELMIVETPVHAVIETLKVAHRVKPDFLTFWNMDFDIGKIIAACDKYGIDPKDIFSDPGLPPEYRYFNYKQGKDRKITASGKVTPIKPANRWHTVSTPASFYPIDSMCVYRHLRLARQELQSYSLDFVLKTEGLKGKLKFEEADDYSGLRWHMFMQEHYPIEYIIYNRYDCICIELLDEKTGDLGISLPLFAGYSDYQFFSSQPRRIVDDLHFAVQEDNKIIASTGKDMGDDFEDDSLSLKDWIITLPAHTIADNGLKVIIEAPELRTRVYTEVGDLDVTGAYPKGQVVFNISKETTSKEIVEIAGIPERTFRLQNINLSGGHTNAVEYCQLMMGFPSLDEIGNAFDKLN